MDYLNSSFILVILSIFIGLYGTIINHHSHSFLKKLFINPIFKIVFLSMLLIYRIDNMPIISFAIIIFFILSSQKINDTNIKQNLDYFKGFKQYFN